MPASFCSKDKLTEDFAEILWDTYMVHNCLLLQSKWNEYPEAKSNNILYTNPQISLDAPDLSS